MRVDIDTAKIGRNIDKSRTLTTSSIALMFKDFYEDIYYHLGGFNGNIYSKNIPGSVCYGLNSAQSIHRGCIVADFEKYCFNRRVLGISEYYIPINANDNREGLCLEDAVSLCRRIQADDRHVSLYGLITSGCLNDKSPSLVELDEIYKHLNGYVKYLTLGGSFWLAKSPLPDYIGEVRIGEYMLFGTIPYDSRMDLLGECAITVKAKVLRVYPERRQFIIDCGYSLADVDKCSVQTLGLRYIDSSSEYSVFEYSRPFSRGEEVVMIPNYKSLVKLRYAERNYL